jgi:hypothetical protein
LRQWWEDNAWYKMKMTEEDYRLYQFANMVTYDSTINVITPCEAVVNFTGATGVGLGPFVSEADALLAYGIGTGGFMTGLGCD